MPCKRCGTYPPSRRPTSPHPRRTRPYSIGCWGAFPKPSSVKLPRNSAMPKGRFLCTIGRSPLTRTITKLGIKKAICTSNSIAMPMPFTAIEKPWKFNRILPKVGAKSVVYLTNRNNIAKPLKVTSNVCNFNRINLGFGCVWGSL